MAYTLITTLKDSYIIISAEGTQTLEDNIKLAHDCVEACKTHGVNRVLVDIRGLSGQPGVVADYELARLITAWETAKLVSKSALLEKESDMAAGKFFETTIRNRGINLCVFSDPQKAEKWISE